MKLLAAHPGPLMYTKIYLRLEPLGLELVAEAARRAGHEVRLIDLQAERPDDFLSMVDDFEPDVIAWSCNYLANVPEIVDLSKAAKARRPRCHIAVGGHSASFTAEAFLRHGAGAIDCVLKGEGEPGIVALLEAVACGASLDTVPGAVTTSGEGPAPGFVESLDDLMPARDLLRHRKKYFIGSLDPAASIEFSRGCPWDCSFCSAWTFYGRSYRVVSPDRAVEELSRVKEPGVFIVDDVAFIQERHGLEIGEQLMRRGIKKNYYLETRADVLLRNKDVFRLWRKLGLTYMFIGLEAIDDEGLTKFRKRVPMGKNYEALEFARELGLTVAINIIADPDWDKQRFETVRQWCLEVPEVVNISVNTPYPGTESWRTEARRLTSRDYRLFDIQHAVLPTKLPLDEFYAELIKTQQILAKKHLGWKALTSAASMTTGLLMKGQTNFFKMLWKFDQVYRPDLLMADHAREVRYQMDLPPAVQEQKDVVREDLYIHKPKGRRGRALDDGTEKFVDETRMSEAL